MDMNERKHLHEKYNSVSQHSSQGRNRPRLLSFTLLQREFDTFKNTYVYEIKFRFVGYKVIDFSLISGHPFNIEKCSYINRKLCSDT